MTMKIEQPHIPCRVFGCDYPVDECAMEEANRQAHDANEMVDITMGLPCSRDDVVGLNQAAFTANKRLSEYRRKHSYDYYVVKVPRGEPWNVSDAVRYKITEAEAKRIVE